MTGLFFGAAVGFGFKQDNEDNDESEDNEEPAAVASTALENMRPYVNKTKSELFGGARENTASCALLRVDGGNVVLRLQSLISTS